MNKWDFKTLQITKNGNAELIELSHKQKERIDKYTEALEVAAQSVVANPPFSNYFVKESIGFINDDLVSAGNIEYGICQALHGEESAVAAFRARYGRSKTGEIILGIIAGNPGSVPSPCGNCRDIMLEDLGNNFEIVSGAPEGGTAVITRMSNFLFDTFEDITHDLASEDPEVTLFKKRAQEVVTEGERLINDAYSPPSIHPERRYHALIVTEQNDFFGARDIMCEYHPIYALRDAIRQARRAHDPHIASVLIVCEDFGGGAPHVMYKDRQHLLELNLQQELLSGIERNPPVCLVTYRDGGKELTRAWKTSTKEWLPFPFSPRNFGPAFIEYLTNYFKNLKRQ